MPPRTRKTATDDSVVEPGRADTQLPTGLAGVVSPCPACFPTGWPGGASAVGCEHGQWVCEATA